MLQCLIFAAFFLQTATPVEPANGGIRPRIDRKVKVASGPNGTESDGQLVNRAFQQLSSNPAAAAEIAGTRLLADTALQSRHRAALLWIAGSGLSISGRHREAMLHLEEGECLAYELQDRKLQRRILRYIAASACELADYRRGKSAAAEALEISRELNDQSDYVGMLHSELANNCSSLGEIETAVRHYRAALEIADASGNQKLGSMILANLAHLYVDQQQYTAAIEMHQRSLAIARQQNLPLVVSTVQLNLAETLLKGGFPEEARKLFLEILNLEDSAVNAPLKAGAQQGMGDYFLGSGNPERAQQHLELAQAAWIHLQNPAGLLAVEQRLTALKHSQLKNVEETRVEMRQQLEQELSRAREMQNAQLILSVSELLIQHHIEAGNWQQATELLRETRNLQSELWKESATKELAAIRTEMQVLEQQQANEELSHRFSLQQAQLQEQRRLMLILTIGITLLACVLLMLWRTLAARRRIIAELRAAEAEIRRQKQVQLAIERQMAEEQKAQSLAVMAAGIAHDFNNLLTIITGLAEIGHYRIEAQQKDELFSQISAATLQAADLTSQLLQFLGRPANSMECVDLCSVVNSTRGLLSSLVRTRADLQIESDNGPLLTCIPSGSIQQILINLVSNAADAMIAPAEIVIRTSRRHLTAEVLAGIRHGEQTTAGEFCLLQVSDCGDGIPEEIRSRIFDPYFSTKAAGRGLGLASVLGIVRSCGGAIDVDSNPAPTDGKFRTNVSVYLPLQPETDRYTSARLQQQSAITESVKGLSCGADSVLLVDDEQRVLRYVSQILQNAGYRVLTAADATTGLALARQHAAELCCVVTDYTMPGKDGVWLASRIHDALPKLPVVICSGYGPDYVAATGGLYTFVQKPYLPQDLLRTIERVCEGNAEPVERIITER